MKTMHDPETIEHFNLVNESPIGQIVLISSMTEYLSVLIGCTPVFLDQIIAAGEKNKITQDTKAVKILRAYRTARPALIEALKAEGLETEGLNDETESS